MDAESTSPIGQLNGQSTVERRCRRTFNRLHRLSEKLKGHDHQSAHFNVQNALQFIEAQGIDRQFTQGAARKQLVECAAAEKVLSTCVHHLDSCLKTCERMGTSEWSASDDRILSDSWTMFVANFKHAGRLLGLPELDLRPFLGLQPNASAANSMPTLARKGSDFSESSSAAETIEYWNARREQQDQARLAALRTGRVGVPQALLTMTATGTQVDRRVSPVPMSSGASSVSSGSSLFGSSTVPTVSCSSTLVQPSAPATPRVEKAAPMINVVPHNPPPPYPSLVSTPSIMLISNGDVDKKDTSDHTTAVSHGIHRRHHSDSSANSLRRIASDISLASAGSSTAQFHFHAGSNPSFHLQPPYMGPRTPFTPTASPAMPRMSFQPPQQMAPIAYKPSHKSLRETAALHLMKRGAPNLFLHAVKPETTCEHGVVHFKQHAYCGWGNCCNRRGCEG